MKRASAEHQTMVGRGKYEEMNPKGKWGAQNQRAKDFNKKNFFKHLMFDQK